MVKSIFGRNGSNGGVRLRLARLRAVRGPPKIPCSRLLLSLWLCQRLRRRGPFFISTFYIQEDTPLAFIIYQRLRRRAFSRKAATARSCASPTASISWVATAAAGETADVLRFGRPPCCLRSFCMSLLRSVACFFFCCAMSNFRRCSPATLSASMAKVTLRWLCRVSSHLSLVSLGISCLMCSCCR